MRPTDLSLTVSPNKLACVLDPKLALGYAHGPTMALRLARILEIWLTRSFWQVIDASDLLPGLLGATCAGSPPRRILPNAAALSAWMTMRETTDAASWRLRWMGDSVAESQIRDGHAPDIVERYEHLASTLGARGHTSGTYAATWAAGLDSTMAAFDALALSATLEGAPVLSVVEASDAPVPWLVQVLELAGVAVTSLNPVPSASLFAAERGLMRDALVTAGLASVAMTLPPLAVVHLLAGAEEAAADGDGGEAIPATWKGARAWWYRV